MSSDATDEAPAAPAAAEPERPGPLARWRARRGRRPGPVRTGLVLGGLLALVGSAGAVGSRMFFDPEGGQGAASCWVEEVPGAGNLATTDGCPALTGRAGLAWVFPSFDPERERCRPSVREGESSGSALAGDDVAQRWTCSTTVRGTPVTLTYSQVRDPESAQRTLDRAYGVDERAPLVLPSGPSVLEWRPSQAVAGRWVLAALLRDQPYLIEVSAASAEELVAGLRRVRARPDAELVGQLPPTEAPQP